MLWGLKILLGKSSLILPCTGTYHSIKDLILRAKIIKFLEENIGGNLHDMEFGNNSMHMISKAQVTKDKIDKLDFIQIKNFCASKDI